VETLDDASIKNDSAGTCTQVKKNRSKQLPVPVSVREAKGDDLILSDNVSGKLWFSFSKLMWNYLLL